MFKQLIINGIAVTGIITGLFIQPALPETYTGGVSSGISRVELQSDNYTTGVSQEELEPTSMTIRIKPPIDLSKFEDPRLDREAARYRPPVYTATVQHRLAAIGISWNLSNGQIYYIDRHSDLYGQINLGDRLLTLGGQERTKAWHEKTNFGPDGTVMQVGIATQAGVVNIACIRHDISWFTPDFQYHLMTGY